MATSAYRLPDEPLPSGLSKWAVDPLWPLLAVMLAGNGVGMAWSVFNGLAMGSPTRRREWLLVAGNLLGCLAVAVGTSMLRRSGWLAQDEVAYAMLVAVTVKLAVSYAIYMMQSRCFELFEHFGGKARNGLPVAVLLAFFAGPAVARLPHPWLAVVLG